MQPKRNYLAGICCFFKIVRDYQGDLTILPTAEDVELRDLSIVGQAQEEVVSEYF